MKKIFNILLLTLALGFVSCVGEVEDIFDKSSAQRAADAIKKDRDVLVSAKNGWVLSMKADPKNEHGVGAYNIYLKFNADSTVTVSSELAESTEVYTSHYSIKQSQGIVLTFDEYNPLIHYFSDPVNPDGFGMNGKGLEGDFEFLFVSANSDKVVLKGKKTEINMTMVPVKEGVVWADEINKIHKVSDEMLKSTDYIMTIQEGTSIDTINVSRMIRVFNIEGDKGIIQAPFVIKQTGIEFVSEVTVKGHVIKGFTYDPSKEYFEASNNSNIKLHEVSLVQPTKLFMAADAWYMSRSNMSANMQAFYDEFDADCEAEGLQIGLGCVYYSNYQGTDYMDIVFLLSDGTERKEVGMYYKFSKINDTLVATNLYGYGTNGKEYYEKTSFQKVLAVFDGNLTITMDDPNDPSKLRLTNADYPSYSLVLSSDAIYYPTIK